MSLLGPLQRTLRPTLSLRYQLLLRRHQSTTTSPVRRNRTTILYASLSLLAGGGVGLFALHNIAPPPMPSAGTHEDRVLLADLNKRIDEEFKVKVLRGKCLGVAKALKGKEGGWVEILPASEGMEKEFINTMQGAKGLAVERVFWDRGEQRLVAVVYFGGALSGWPGVTHGGLLATAMEEKITLANYLAGGGDSSANAAVAPQRLPGTGNHATVTVDPASVLPEPAQVSIDYKKPTYANNFHVIRVRPAYDTDEDVRMPVHGHEWIATLEMMDKDATVCVRTTARFDSKGVGERAKGKVQEGVRWSYSELREWLWPSRQRESLGG
ncbi:hypothetical protein M409DRAFT_30020 [Zasmidium cellare ATCC 36951]|uniref:Thioesterase domain-containing protein n=1 Tax=Zasmidium cellare ATCC 36951 TaxID=1080233 RepID=A0A6A6BXI4_ZASCE|nr:uncharacterized protein M409DRAFT_30020 [Zasmidium cellare ATCC 36951]KAF2159544.1 hypothetical protein M409DRAFT_30020 [Zasmidium cellare ATCC 36951]